jgi:hypothetical protein
VTTPRLLIIGRAARLQLWAVVAVTTGVFRGRGVLPLPFVLLFKVLPLNRWRSVAQSLPYGHQRQAADGSAFPAHYACGRGLFSFFADAMDVALCRWRWRFTALRCWFVAERTILRFTRRSDAALP